MRLKRILLILLACVALAVSAQPTQQQPEWEWYLDEVVNETFVGRNYFEYYYTPSASDMEQQRGKGEVSYFLNSPAGMNSKKVRDMIDRLMASYDDIKAVGEWHMTNTTYWKEFRFDKNKFRFSVKRKALDDGTYYVSVTETAGYYKSLGKKEKKDEQEAAPKAPKAKDKKSSRHSTRGRRQITQDDVDDNADVAAASEDETDDMPVVSEQERRRAARQSEEERRQQERLAKRRAQEEQQAQEKAQKEAEKQRKAEEKKQKAEEKRIKQQEEKQRREQQRREREQERRDKEAARKQAAAPKVVESKFHYTDVALWLSEKYDFTQTAGDSRSCTMYSTAVKDVEMAKLAIKNALKGSNARMTVPWRVNSETQEIETGYTVDGHVLVFSIGNNDDGKITLTVTEVSNEQFEEFKQSLGN